MEISSLFSPSQPFFFSSSTKKTISDFDKLAHGPQGTQAKHSMSIYRFHPADGSLVLLNVQGDPRVVTNPAFSRYHPRLNVVYTCTEDCGENGKIFAYKMSENGELTQLGDAVDAGGTSTCYLTIDRAQTHMLAVNYWNSTLAVIPIDRETGQFTGPIKNLYDPKLGQAMVATGRCHGGVNHSNNDESTIRMRQADPHSHALVLDPFVGTVAYVPDLGKDLVREFLYNREAGKIEMELNVMPSGLCTGMPDGPRYFEFHPKYNVAYVVNELSSTIAVFEVDRALLQEMAAASAAQRDMSVYKGRSTLRLIQSIKTIPRAFPTTMNTCGRICVHRNGRFVVVSNRGHQSIAIYRVQQKGGHRGELVCVGFFHTRGETPRHFQFDASGQYLLVANQDTDSIAVFNFNLSSGEIKYTGNEYRVKSPNFVCCCPVYGDGDEEFAPAPAAPVVTNIRLVEDHQGVTASSGGGGCESETSSNSCTFQQPTTTTGKSAPSHVALEQELLRAREEIAELNRKLSTLSAN
jgi:6-phosphogluconolactonase